VGSELQVHGSAPDIVKNVIGSFRTGSLGCNLTSPVPSDLLSTVEVLLAVDFFLSSIFVATVNLL
jgi:hypothetical protein